MSVLIDNYLIYLSQIGKHEDLPLGLGVSQVHTKPQTSWGQPFRSTWELAKIGHPNNWMDSVTYMRRDKKSKLQVYYWLVVWTALQNMNISWDYYFHFLEQLEFMFQTTKQTGRCFCFNGSYYTSNMTSLRPSDAEHLQMVPIVTWLK